MFNLAMFPKQPTADPIFGLAPLDRNDLLSSRFVLMELDRLVKQFSVDIAPGAYGKLPSFRTSDAGRASI
jgi:hypothetical protein